MRFEGNWVAIVTPFRNGTVDYHAFEHHATDMISGGVSGIVVAGTTGEAAQLSEDEFAQLIRSALITANGRCTIMAGVGSNSTSATLQKIEAAKKAGAQALLIVTPYYVKPTPSGLVEHFKACSRAAAETPIMLYNVPGRTGVNMLPTTLSKLLDCSNILGIKEASANLEQISQAVQIGGDRIHVLSGDDSLTLPSLAVGARGVVSVLSNVLPREVTELCAAFRFGNTQKAAEIHHRVLPLAKALFIESNPIPVKTALSLMGKINGEFRLPLVPMEKSNLEFFKTTLKEMRLI